MLTCIPCSHKNQFEEDDNDDGTPNTNKAIKSLTTQIKDMALKASGAYRHCKPSSDPHHQQHQSKKNKKTKNYADHSEAFRRTTSSNSMPRVWGKEMESRLKGLSSSSEGTTPSSLSGRVESIVFMEEEEEKEWIAQVEPGVLITFVSLRQGGNDLKRIRFSREMFNKWQAQRWWAENFDKVMELYNVQRFNHQAVPLPTPPRSEDESSKIESVEDTPMTPPLSKERLPRNFHRPMGMGYSSSDSLDHHSMPSRHYNDSIGQASTPKLSSISGTKTETSSMDASIRTSSSNRSGELSVSNASDVENEWDEQDEPGVFITIRSLPGGTRELRRVRFSRERFGEMHARLWWEENRARIHEQYLNL